MTHADTQAVVAALDRILRATEANQRELDRLDAIVGDGDHGVTMVLGWRAVLGELTAAPPTSPGDALRRAAASFATVGGTAGPLWGTALLRAGRALGDSPFADVAAVARAATAAVEGIRVRGRCNEGEKTLIDAMAPAARALCAAADRRDRPTRRARRRGRSGSGGRRPDVDLRGDAWPGGACPRVFTRLRRRRRARVRGRVGRRCRLRRREVRARSTNIVLSVRPAESGPENVSRAPTARWRASIANTVVPSWDAHPPLRAPPGSLARALPATDDGLRAKQASSGHQQTPSTA